MASDSFLLNQLRSAYTKAGNRIYMGVPEGAIIAWSGGYFTDGINGGFTSVLGNTVAAVNALFNEFGFYVCNGAETNISKSQIFNDSGRYLPNLTDSRFLMGSTGAGSIGGSGTMPHTHSVTSNVAVAAHVITQPDFTIPSHSHPLASFGSVGSMAVGVRIGNFGADEGLVYPAAGGGTLTQRKYFTDVSGGGGGCTRTVDVALTNNHAVTNNAVASGAASNDSCLPTYLTCFYLIKVF